MLIAIIGENCAGKSTLAAGLQRHMDAEVISGRDYLRMAKSESEAAALFRARLADAVRGENIIYIIGEAQLLELLPDGAVRVLARADLDTIKARFRARMRGSLPAPVEKMLEKKHGIFDAVPHDFTYDGAAGDADALWAQIEAARRP